MIDTIELTGVKSTEAIELVGEAGVSQQIVATGTVALRGPSGRDGAGVAGGGATNQVLRKVNSETNNTEWHTLTKDDVDLGNVDNTPDSEKPVSNPVQAALNNKVAKGELVVNVKDYGAAGDGVTDDTAAFDAAMAAGEYVIVPDSPTPYLIKYLSMPTKTTLVGQGRPQINLQRSGSSVISRIRTLCVLENLYLNCIDEDLEWNRIGIESATNVVVRDCRIDGFRHDDPLPNAWGLFIDQSSFVKIDNCVFDNNSQSDIAIVDSCSYIEISRCKPGVSTFVVNVEPNGSAVSSKIVVNDSRITKAMTWDYSDIASPVDNVSFKDCVIDLFRYGGGNVIYENTFITSFEAISTASVGNRGGKIGNIKSFGYGKNLNPDPYFHKIINSGGDPKLSWMYFYSPDGNVIDYKEDSRGKFLSLNPNGLNTTVSITRIFSVAASTLYTIRSLLNVYYPTNTSGTHQFAIEYYDASDQIIGTRKYIIVDKKNGKNSAESEWDEKQFFFNTPALCTSVKVFVISTTMAGTNNHRLNIQYMLLNEVLLNARNFIDEPIRSYIQSGPNTSALSPVGVTGQNQSLVGQKIYAPDPGTHGYDGWVCITSGNPGVWKKVAPTETLMDTKEGAIAAGTSAQYFRGDKTMHTLNQDAVPDGITNKAYTVTEKTKLSGVATGATANDTDANLKNRANHTGTQSADTITDGTTNKVYTAVEKTKLADISGTNTGDQTATTVPNIPAGNIAATTVQAAIDELDTEKADLSALALYLLKAGDIMTGNLTLPQVLINNTTTGIASTTNSGLMRISGGTVGDGALIVMGGSTSGSIPNIGALRVGITNILEWNSQGLVVGDGKNIIINSATGTKIGTATNQKFAFWNATPIVQPSGAALTALANLGLISSPTLAESDITNLVSDLALKAPLASPALTGSPTAPTQSSNDNSTKIATTAYVDNGMVKAISAPKTSDYTLTGVDYTVLFDATSGNLTANLPAAVSHNKRIFVIKKIDASVNTITVDGNASETIDGALTNVLSAQWATVRIQSDGSNWYII